jgi:hypothetical protein
VSREHGKIVFHDAPRSGSTIAQLRGSLRRPVRRLSSVSLPAEILQQPVAGRIS